MAIILVPYTDEIGSVDHLISNAEGLARRLGLDFKRADVEMRVLLSENERFLLGYGPNCYDAKTFEIAPPEKSESGREASLFGRY